MPSSARDLPGMLAAMALGVAAYFVLVGWQLLLPSNIGWLNSGDRAIHMLGWMFFREAPWQNPPGMSPDLGIELSSSIALVDALPLFALPAKLLRDWLPEPFQYWGYWLLLCCTLHSLFAYLLARELRVGRWLALAAAAFALISPAFMYRVPMHLALGGQWTVIAALYLYARRDPPSHWMWPLLAATTAAIQPYLLAMVLSIWLAAGFERLGSDRIGRVAARLEIVAVLGVTVVVLWLEGFFTRGSVGSEGYGDFRLNLLWPFISYDHWSQIFPAVPHAEYDYEGMSFLGIGAMALLLIAILSGAVLKLKALGRQRWLPLAIVLVLMMIFAFSYKIAFADRELFAIPLPDWARNAASIFRTTGRFVWPILYFITIGAVVLIARHFRPALAVPLVLVALAAQLIDSGPQLLGFAASTSPSASRWSTPLQSPFWERAAAAGYNRVRAIPVESPGRDWKILGYYAVTHGMDTDSAELGRTNQGAMTDLRAREAEALHTGNFEPHTLYDLDADSARQAAAHLAPGDLLANIDGLIILAKGGVPLADGLGIPPLAAP